MKRPAAQTLQATFLLETLKTGSIYFSEYSQNYSTKEASTTESHNKIMNKLFTTVPPPLVGMDQNSTEAHCD